MKKPIKITSFIFIPIYLCFSAPAFSNNYMAIGETSNSDGASISHSLTSEIRTTKKNAFLSDEPLNLSFQLNIANKDIGFQSDRFLLAYYNGYTFMLTPSGWLSWDGQASSLQSFSSRQLQAQENISVLDNQSIPTGEYILIAAYRSSEGNINYSQDYVAFIVSDKDKASLHRIQTGAFLTNYLNYVQAYPTNTYSPEVIAFADSTFSGTTSGASSSSLVNTSQTNLQETGVDESDKIKTSGEFLFALEKCNASNVSDKPSEESDSGGITVSEDALFAPYPDPIQNKTCLSSYRLQENPAAATMLDKEELNSSYYTNGSLFLNEGSDNASPDRLVWLSSSMAYDFWASWSSPYYWTDNTTTLKFYDISSPDNLTLKHSLSLEGALISSRRIGDNIYLVTRKNHYNKIVPLEDNVTQKNTETATILPTIAFNGITDKPLVNATDCYVPASQSDLNYDGTIITITSLSISNPENYQSSCIVGNIETVYASTQALYLATSRYPYYSVNNVISYDQAPEYSTEIHKFAFTDSHVSYQASGTVPGHLGWEMDKKPFRMGEYNGILKVATSLGQSWDMNSRTRVGVLQENSATQILDEISHIDNLGKPGEKLYAARFIGHRGYLVTFRVTDPLYMLDFTIPGSPKVLGELEIEGYSDYLHPIGENYLLGIGKDAVPDTSATDFAGRGAWYQGVKLSLFDVSDGDNLKEVQSIIIGERGSSSAILSDHHALAWLAADEPDKFRLAIPIDEHSTPNEWSNYQSPSAFYDWTQTGAYVFDIHTGDSPALSLSEQFISESLKNNDQQVSSDTDRIVLQGNTLHFVHDNTIFSSEIKD